MPYTFDPLFAADPNNPAMVAKNAAVLIFDPAVPNVAITITDATGSPIPNPITVNAAGFGPAFQHATLDRVGWSGGGFENYITSYEGMKQVATDAQAAAQSAASNAGQAAAADLAARITAGQFKGKDGADGSNVLPTDAAVAAAINGSGATRAAIESARADAVDGVIASLDYRKSVPLVFASCSDSTGDQDNEWYELSLKESFAALWPDRAVDLKRWNKAGEAFYATVPWQTGIFAGTTAVVDPAAVLYSDTFSRTGFASGSSPDIGNSYTSTNATAYSVDGSKLTLTGTASQFLVAPSIPAETPDFKLAADLTWAYTGAGFASVELMVGKDLTNYLRLHVEGTSTATATLRKMIGGTLTTVATFTNPVFNGVLSTQTVSLELAGTTVTAKIAGETVTATLTAGDVTALSGATREARYRTSATNFALDNVVLTGQKTTAAASAINPGLPKVTVYTGGAAGETTAYHQARIAAMYPEQPDLVFINHGHNYATGATPATVQADFQAFLDALFAVWQPCPVVVISQNPEFGTGKEAAHKGWMLALRGYAQRKGWGYIPTYEAFMSLPDGGSSEVPDGLHPGIGTGRRRQADVAKAWIAGMSQRPS